MADQGKSTWSKVLTGVMDSFTPENVQRYILGTKKNGQYRAVYDVLKDYTSDKNKKKKNKGKKDKNNTHSLYLSIKGKKGKGKKKKNKHFRF